ncbi:MAG: hypothetical protein ACO1OB_22325 [Archangium sp.]
MASLFAAFLLWLYVGDVVRWVRLQLAPVAVMTDAPSLPFAIVGTVIALALVAKLISRVTGKPLLPARVAAWVPALAVMLPLVDLIVVSSRREFLFPEELLVGAAHTVAQAASQNSGAEFVARDPSIFEQAVAPFTDVPVYVNGERVPKWKVQLREGCSGPATDALDATPGTIVYCVAADRRQAWVNVVATAGGATFGPAAMSGLEAPWVARVQVARAAEVPPPEPVWESPTPE